MTCVDPAARDRDRPALRDLTFRCSYRFLSDGRVVSSDSMLRFPNRDEMEASLAATGFTTLDVRDAPDRPGREYVVIAARFG